METAREPEEWREIAEAVWPPCDEQGKRTVQMFDVRRAAAALRAAAERVGRLEAVGQEVVAAADSPAFVCIGAETDREIAASHRFRLAVDALRAALAVARDGAGAATDSGQHPQ